jgi:membrane associated rhomboid family serine protease/ribosomal protein L37AE/L43A
MDRQRPDLICPRCNAALQRVQTEHGIFWACSACGGRAVGLELLRRTFTPDSINPLWLHAINGENISGATCPSCQNPMIQVTLSDRSAIRVDVCRICHFVWFDAHEADDLVPRPPPPPTENERLPQKAREILAVAKIEQMARDAEGSDFDSAAPSEWWQVIAAYFGMPVEFDAIPLERKPWVTWTLALAIVCVFILTVSNLHDIVRQYGLIPAEATRLGSLTLLTSFFLHGGVIHLFGNTYFLMVFGDNVENFIGRGRYLVLIALAHLVGSLAHIAADPNSTIPCIGASAGIAGIITFYALQFPHARLALMFRWGFYWFRWIRLPAWFGLVLWILFQLVGAWAQIRGMSQVSAFGHLGGVVWGLAAWFVWRRRNGAILETSS